MEIKKGSVVLFQGDSITYAGRNYEDDSLLGTGYAMMSAAWFNALHPELNIKFINRGASGDTALRLKERWQRDCIDLKPDVVSILIGINDCGRGFEKNDPSTAEEFKANYGFLLNEIKNKLNAQLILCEPFLIPAADCGKQMWRQDLDAKIHVIRELAREFNAAYLPFDGIFASASTKRAPEFWAADGIHPSHAGHALMAKSWLEAVKAI